MVEKINGDTEKRMCGVSDNRLGLGPPFLAFLLCPLLTVRFCFLSQSKGPVENDGEFLTAFASLVNTEPPPHPQWTHYVWEFDEAYCMDKVSVLCL